jgi:CheY-like chemotaxis protein
MARILVVDDEYAFAEFEKLLLEGLGHKALICLDGSKAVDMALVHRPELIILDLNMEEMDGLDLIERLKAREETKCIPLILASSSTDKADRAEALKRGAVYSILKPIQKETLKLLIDRLVPGK